jgi:hypothetical protein
MPQETLIGTDGQPVPCWRPLPNHWLPVAGHPTVEAAQAAMRRLYPAPNRPDLWAAHPAAFGHTPEAN